MDNWVIEYLSKIINSLTMRHSEKLQLRNRRIEIRLTEEEYARIAEKSVGFCSKGHYIRSAIREFSDINAKQRLAMIDELAGFYKEHREFLSHISGNLNQAVKRANELSLAGLLTPAYLSQVLMPSIDDTKKFLDTLQGELRKVSEKVYRKFMKGSW